MNKLQDDCDDLAQDEFQNEVQYSNIEHIHQNHQSDDTSLLDPRLLNEESDAGRIIQSGLSDDQAWSNQKSMLKAEHDTPISNNGA